jgi:hypothetical protein
VTLQITLPTDYFLVMSKVKHRRATAALWRLGGALAIASIGACEERDRLTFPNPDPTDGVGPEILIDQPSGADTSVEAGPDFFVNGRAIDPDGVDTVYFFVTGGSQNFPPLHPSPVTDTVTFGLPIVTAGQAGESLTVQIYGVDAEGLQGGTTTRQINVQ